jgi:hypothetical protein
MSNLARLRDRYAWISPLSATGPRLRRSGVLRDGTAGRQADGGAHAAARGGKADGRGAGKPDQENLEPAVDSGAGRP